MGAARVAGINVDRVRIVCYMSSGVMAGLVGILLASRLGQGTPTVGTTYELWAIAATVIGGTSLFGGEGTILGVLIGAALMQTIRTGLNLLGFPAYWQPAAIGAVIICGVMFDQWRKRRQHTA